MKHIFAIYSHLTFYVTKQIIIEEKIPNNECIIILVSNYKLLPQYSDDYPNCIQLSYGGYVKQGRYFAGINVFQTIQNIRKFDAMINDYLDGDNFISYIGHCRSDIENLLVTNKKCHGYYIIEEGSGSYGLKNIQTFHGLKKIAHKLFLKPIFPRLFCIKELNFYTKNPKFKGFYATSEKSFPIFNQEKKIIHIPFDYVNLGYTPDAVISIDPLFLFTNMKSTKVIYEQLSKYIARKNYRTIAYKFHQMFAVRPEMKEEYMKLIHTYFGDGLIELDNNNVLENILNTYKCDFYSAGSSVSIYGTLAGAKCYSFIPLLQKHCKMEENPVLKNFFINIEIPQ